MSWLERATREILEKPKSPTAKTDETHLSAVLAVPHPHFSQKSGGSERAPERFSASDCATFERIAAALRAELERRPTLAGIAAYRQVLDRQTGERLTCIISARRAPDGTVSLGEIAGNWPDPTLPDLERWTPPGEPS
jgi:hypothetical protein